MSIPVYSIDDKRYMLINKTELNDNMYLFLLNENDDDDYLIRKIDKENSDYLIPLDDENEVYEVLKTILEV